MTELPLDETFTVTIISFPFTTPGNSPQKVPPKPLPKPLPKPARPQPLQVRHTDDTNGVYYIEFFLSKYTLEI